MGDSANKSGATYGAIAAIAGHLRAHAVAARRAGRLRRGRGTRIHRAGLCASRSLLLRQLPQMGLPLFAPPDGAFYIYVDISHLTTNSARFCTGRAGGDRRRRHAGRRLRPRQGSDDIADFLRRIAGGCGLGRRAAQRLAEPLDLITACRRRASPWRAATSRPSLGALDRPG